MRRKEGSDLLPQQLCLILEEKMVNAASNERKNGDSQGPGGKNQEFRPLDVKEVNVPREKERSMLKVSEGLRKVTIGKYPLNVVLGG